MRNWIILLVVLLAACAGCFDGRQQGKFAVSSSESRPLANHPGSLTILRGHALTSDYQPAGTDRPLLYFLEICPGLQASGDGSEVSQGSTRSTYYSTWLATPYDVTMGFTWDRSKDTVDIHGQQYDRSNGNIFVAIRQSNGTISSWQVTSLDGPADANEIVRHVREQLPGNQIIADVELVEIP